MTSLPELKSCPEWMRVLIEGFPWNDERTDESLKRSFACEAAGLLSYEEAEKGSFDEQEYGEHVFRLTVLGEQLCRTPSPHNKEITGDAVTREDTGSANLTVTTSPTTIEALREVREALYKVRTGCHPQFLVNIIINEQISALNKIIEGADLDKPVIPDDLREAEPTGGNSVHGGGGGSGTHVTGRASIYGGSDADVDAAELREAVEHFDEKYIPSFSKKSKRCLKTLINHAMKGQGK